MEDLSVTGCINTFVTDQKECSLWERDWLQFLFLKVLCACLFTSAAQIVERAQTVFRHLRLCLHGTGPERIRGPFLESPDNFSGPESYFMCAIFASMIQILLVLKAEQ